MKRIIMSSALALLLVSAGCAQTTVKSTAVEQRTATQESVIPNNVEGTLTVNGEVFKMTHAYARRVESSLNKSKPDVLIVFADRAVARQIFERSDMPNVELGRKAKNDEFRGFDVRITDRESQSEDGKVVQKKTISVGIYHPSLSSMSSHLGGFFTDVDTVTVTQDLAEGKVSGKSSLNSDAHFAPFSYEVSFKVSLRPDEWSGIIYKQPPTNLAPGTASGQVLIDRKPVKFNYVYAVQQVASGELFDDEEMKVRLFFTEKPVPDPAAAFSEKNPNKFQSLKQAGNSYVMDLNISPGLIGPRSAWLRAQASTFDPLVRELEKADDDSSALVVAETNLLLTKFDDKIIDGRIFNDGAMIDSDRASAVDVSFNVATIIKSDSVEAPVNAGNGQPLPAGGGAPGEAYLAFVKAVSTAKNLKELSQLMEASQSAKVFADVKQSLAAVEAGKEQGTLTMFKRVLTIKAARVEGGFASSDKATLSVTGMRDSKKVIFRVNMHLENSQWKVGTGAIREVE